MSSHIHLDFTVKGTLDVTGALAGAQGGLVRYAYVQAPDGVVIELTAYRVTGALRAALPLLAAYNRLVHIARRTLVKAALPRSEAPL